MKTALALTILGGLLLLAVSVNGVARRSRKYGAEFKSKNNSTTNETRRVVKLNRPRWNQHEKWPEPSYGRGYQVDPVDPFEGLFVDSSEASPSSSSSSASNESNVCEREEVNVKPGNGKNFFILSCHRGKVLGKCTKIIGDGNATKTTTTFYECCPGYEIGPVSDRCDMKISDLNLKEALIEGGRGEFVTAFDSFNLTSAYLTNPDGQFTVFAPTNESLDAFVTGLENVNELESFVEITPDLMETAKHIRGRLVSHVVPEVIKDVPVFTSLKLRTAHHDGVVFLKRNFPKEKDEYGITANCIPVTSSQRVKNGMIYYIDGFLQSSELSLVQLLETRTDAQIFKSLLEKANLSIFNDNETILTVFVPTDQAFEKNPTLMRRISSLPAECLKDLLLNHIFLDFNCASRSAALRNLMEDSQIIRQEDGGSYKIGEAKVIEKDVVTSNGLVHFIDAPLVPATVLSAPELSKAARATKFGDMLESLEFEPSDGTSFTMIIPTNQALEEYLKRNSSYQMTTSQLVDYHTIPGAGNIIDKSSVQTAHGNQTILLELSRSGLKSLKLSAQCVPIHVIRRYHRTCYFHAFFTNKVLEPARSCLLELMQEDGELNKFLAVVRLSEMESEFKSGDKIMTVFAPSDKQMEKLPKDVKEKLSKNKEYARSFVSMHVSDELNCLSDGLVTVKTRSGETHHLTKNRIDWIPLTTGKSQRMATNGVLHHVQGILRPFYRIQSAVPSFFRFDSPFNTWHPFIRICWSNDDDEICEEFEKK